MADFGLACEVTEPLYAVCGTPTYVAPEILMETGYGLKVSIAHKTHKWWNVKINPLKIHFFTFCADRCLGSRYYIIYTPVRFPTICFARQSTGTAIRCNYLGYLWISRSLLVGHWQWGAWSYCQYVTIRSRCTFYQRRYPWPLLDNG